jgi:hypothetical protein
LETGAQAVRCLFLHSILDINSYVPYHEERMDQSGALKWREVVENHHTTMLDELSA